MTVLENLEMGAFTRNDRNIRADIDRVYELFPRLKEREKQKAGTMSGGEQQMLAIGRALMANPKLLLLDEPSLGLAPVIVDKIYEIIREINARGVTILLVEQNANYALDVSHRGYVLETGKVVLSNDSASLRTDPEVQKAYLGDMTPVFAADRLQGALPLYIWLLCAISRAELSRSKGYGEKSGLGTGLMLTILGPIIWLAIPPKDGPPSGTSASRGSAARSRARPG